MVFWISPMVSLNSRANILASFTISRSGTPGCRLPALAAEAGVNFPLARASIAASRGERITLPGSLFLGNWRIVKVSPSTIFRCTPLMYARVSSRITSGVPAQVERSRLPKGRTFSNERASVLDLRVTADVRGKQSFCTSLSNSPPKSIVGWSCLHAPRQVVVPPEAPNDGVWTASPLTASPAAVSLF
jgi:hypothetical protein